MRAVYSSNPAQKQAFSGKPLANDDDTLHTRTRDIETNIFDWGSVITFDK